MKNRLSPFQKELLHKIEEILYTDWNPLGGDDVIKDEYDSYALQVFSIVQWSWTVEDISNYLYEIETNHIGIVGDREKCWKVAEKIGLLSLM